MTPNSELSKPPEVVVITRLPTEARLSTEQAMRCEWCGCHYRLPIYEMPDGPVISIARCPRCGSHNSQVPEEMAA
jgi:uncharacterized protein with PIN domain